MPGALDGLYLARYVRTYHPDVPVLITCRDLPAGEMPEELGQVITKPYSLKLDHVEPTKKLRER